MPHAKLLMEQAYDKLRGVDLLFAIEDFDAALKAMPEW